MKIPILRQIEHLQGQVMNNDLIVEKLGKEAYLGRIAKQAYDTYLKNYLNTQHVLLFNEFKSCNDVDALPIKYRINAVEALEEKILEDIDSGHLAQRQLDEIKP
jgi:hypothetical protein